ncbi:MAG: N-6 DNA methylase [Elusimicrobia bacterium]|nr:N-6 DNA methylase [Elusimicrobiota bacterium]
MTEQDRKTAETKIQKLIEKYEAEKSSGKISQYTEAETKTGFIEPLFQALGWDTQNRDEVGLETNISGGRVDYSFKLVGIIKFFVEAKPLKADLNNPEYSEQAINYSWHKGVVWAVLTDFESIKVFNAEWKEDIEKAKAFDLQYTDYSDDFDSLWLLSKESILSGQLDKWSEKFGKKTKKQPVSKQILADLLAARTKLTKNILKYPRLNKISETELDESVQRILDRLIFIRTCEDRNIEQNHLMSAVRNSRRDLSPALHKIFREFDEAYNSKLFEKHLCDQLTIDDEVLKEVIESLYQTQDGNIHYDFNAINADVLGNIYEQYLGHILKKTSTTTKLKETHQHRKEQGIYYTPTYIVDYIVKNTVGEVLKTAKPKTIQNLKIFDPACGSGSFLIRAFDELVKYWTGELGGVRKPEILQNNIYGVDLDKQAVEITQMNLLLKTLYTRERLPMLKNIRCGNSLIDDPKIAGTKAFKWEEEFPEVFPNACHCERSPSPVIANEVNQSQNGFDVIIGNPPYVDIKGMAPTVVDYLFDKYFSTENRMNLYASFVERAINLLKKDGYFSFIIPNSILYNDSYKKLREFIIKATSIKKIVRLPDNVFEEAKVETIILVLQKRKNRKNKIEIIGYDGNSKITKIDKDNCDTCKEIEQEMWTKTEKNIFNIFSDNVTLNILEKIEKDIKKLEEICDFCLGLTPYDKYKGHTQEQIKNKVFHANYKKSSTFEKLLSGEDIVRYGIFWNGKEWINYGKWLGAPRKQRFFTDPRILVRQIISGKPLRIFASYTDEELYNTQIAFNILVKNKKEFDEKYILAILNSKLMNFYHSQKFLDKSKNLFQKILIVNAKQFPVKVISNAKQQPFTKLVDKILDLNKQLQKFGDKITDERKRLESEIQKTDQQIDELVYKLYDLIAEEIKIVEGK